MKVFKVIQLENGKFGVVDTTRKNVFGEAWGVAFGMTQERAQEWADRLNLRHVWGI